MKMDIIVQRQLDNVSSGNGAYLEMFLVVAQRAGAQVRLVFAPWRSFGNRPWASLHPRFSALVDEVVWPRSVRIGNHFWSVSVKVWARFAIRLGKAALQRIGYNPNIYSFLGDPLSPSEAALVTRVCSSDESRLSVAEYSSLAPVLKHLSAQTKKGVLVHDLFSDRAARFRRNGLKPDFFEISTAQEADWMSAADVCFYASANEMTSFKARLPNSVALWLRPSPRPNVIPSGIDQPRVVFLGTQHAGNLDALRHFIEDIWPLVIAQRPTTQLWVAGSIGRDVNATARRSANVKILGRVDDLSTIGGANSIGIAPTRLATGVSIKVAEYLALGMPSVVYPIALEGFGDALNTLVEIASSPEEFAQRILMLCDDDGKRQRHSSTSAQKIAEQLSNDEVVDHVRNLLQDRAA